MSAIVIVDTSVLMNVLNAPQFNQDREAVLDELKKLINNGSNLLLPMAAIMEAGNHIAHIVDGRLRRACAKRFVGQVEQALDGTAPWRPMPFPDRDQLATWLKGFPDDATRGMGMGDRSIIDLYEQTRRQNPHRRIRIWSRDKHLSAYDTTAIDRS